MLVIPCTEGGSTRWKIWILSTHLEGLDAYPENEALLRNPGRDLSDATNVRCDVLIIGAGNGYA